MSLTLLHRIFEHHYEKGEFLIHRGERVPYTSVLQSLDISAATLE